MTDQELIKRLRVDEPACEEHFTANLAADRIEELVKERKAMAMRDAGYDVYAGLEAKLTKAVEALRNILSGDDLYPWRIAREVLAELGAGK